MRPLSTEITRLGSLGGESIDMTFDQHSLAHIMSVLTDLYSDQELAIIREYSTNALDSHIEAGQTRPIEVTTPTPLDQNFTVRDYGVGLSVQDLVEIYSRYGASTKRDTNAQTGMLGLGCKSALTYVTQFTLTAVKNGVKTVVSVGRKEDGSGVMEIIDTASTDEPNGVVIKIPTKSTNSFERKAKQFFQFWASGTVLLNGKDPSFKNIEWITENIGLVPRANTETMPDNGDYLVMGNVAYPMEDRSFYNEHRWYHTSHTLVAYVPIGSVSFTPSREKLRFDANTLATIESLKQQAVAAFSKHFLDQINEADSNGEAFMRFLVCADEHSGSPLLSFSYSNPPTFGDEQIPSGITVDHFRFYLERKRDSWRKYGYISARDLGPYEKILIVKGFDGVNNPTVRRKIRLYCEANTSKTEVYLFGNDTPDWFDGLDCVDWQTIKSMKTVRTSNGTVWGVREKSEFRTTGGSLVDSNKPVIYMSPRDDEDMADKIHYLAKIDEDAQFLVVGRNRWARLVREFPSAKHVKTFVREKFAEFKDSVPSDVLSYWANMYELSDYHGLDPDRIDDPEVVSAINVRKIDTKQYDNKRTYFERLGCYINRLDSTILNLYTRYPLARYARHASDYEDHLYIYMNAVYAQRKDS